MAREPPSPVDQCPSVSGPCRIRPSRSVSELLGLVGVDIRAVLGRGVLVQHVGVVERILVGEHPLGLAVVDLLGPVGDHQGGDGVAGEVGQGASLAHEPVDRDDQADAGHQVGAVRGQAATQGGQAGAGDSGGALGGDDHEDQQGELLGPGQRGAHGVGDEQRGHGQVHGGAVQVEGVAGGYDDADDGLGDAQVLHLGDQPGERGLGGGGGDDQQVFLTQVVQDLEDVHAGGGLEDAAEDDDDEHGAGGVEDPDEHAERGERRPAGGADDAGDGAERADGGEPHDAGQDLEDEALQDGDEVQDGLALGAEGLDGEADQQRDEQGLQHGAGGERGEQGGGDDVEDEVARPRDVRDGVGRGGGGRLQSLTGVDEVPDQQAEGQCERRHDHEVQQRDAADLADLGGLADRADAQHD